MKNIIIKVCILLICTANIAKSQSFTNYTTANGLPDNFINGGITVDADNHIWVGTASGVAMYDHSTWTTYTTANGLADNYITSIAVDSNNNVWVGTNNKGVSKFNGTSWTSYTTADGLIDNSIIYIAADIDGSVWFATAAGVSRFKDAVWTDYTTASGLPTDILNYISVDANGNKWFGTQMEGVSVYDNSNFTTYSTTPMTNLLDNNVFAVAVDQSNQKWIGTWSGITKLNAENQWVENIVNNEHMYLNFVRELKIDHNNNLWVGTYADYNSEGAIASFDGTNWKYYTITEGLADKQVIRMVIDKENNVWVATGNGVSKLINTVGIESKEPQISFSTYPNPTSGSFNIDGESLNNSNFEVSVYNPVGELIVNEINISSIDLSNYDNGIYFLKIKQDNKVSTQKINLQKQ